MSCLNLTLTVSVVFQAPCQCCFVAVRSVGTFARALDCSSSVKQPSLHMSAAAASRDITLVNTSVPPRITDKLDLDYYWVKLKLDLLCSPSSLEPT